MFGSGRASARFATNVALEATAGAEKRADGEGRTRAGYR